VITVFCLPSLANTEAEPSGTCRTGIFIAIKYMPTRDIKAQIDRHSLEHTVRVQVLDDVRLK